MEFRALCLAGSGFFVRILYNLVRKEINLMSKKMRSNILLLITAAIWGSSFVAQKSGMDYIEPFTYNGIRTLIGGLVLIPVIYVFGKKHAGADGASQKIFDWEKDKVSIIGGLFCGAALFVASSLQQFGVMYTTVGKARLYHHPVYCFRSDYQYFYEKTRAADHVDLRALGRSGLLSALHDRSLAEAGIRRYAGAALRGGVRDPYSDH